MAKILVYNENSNRMETYYRDLSEAMPYNTNRTLIVNEFRGASRSNTLWTTKRAISLVYLCPSEARWWPVSKLARFFWKKLK